jgi:hypothetical protein
VLIDEDHRYSPVAVAPAATPRAPSVVERSRSTGPRRWTSASVREGVEADGRRPDGRPQLNPLKSWPAALDGCRQAGLELDAGAKRPALGHERSPTADELVSRAAELSPRAHELRATSARPRRGGARRHEAALIVAGVAARSDGARQARPSRPARARRRGRHARRRPSEPMIAERVTPESRRGAVGSAQASPPSASATEPDPQGKMPRCRARFRPCRARTPIVALQQDDLLTPSVLQPPPFGSYRAWRETPHGALCSMPAIGPCRTEVEPSTAVSSPTEK